MEQIINLLRTKRTSEANQQLALYLREIIDQLETGNDTRQNILDKIYPLFIELDPSLSDQVANDLGEALFDLWELHDLDSEPTDTVADIVQRAKQNIQAYLDSPDDPRQVTHRTIFKEGGARIIKQDR